MIYHFSNTDSALKRAKEILYESKIFDGVLNLMKWDMKAHMPPSGRPWRTESSTYMTGKRAELFMTDESRALGDYLRGIDASKLETDLDRGVVRRFLHNFDRCTKLPLEIQREISEAHFRCDAAWHAARRANDYQIWRPALEEFFEIKYKASQIIDPNKHPLEVIINGYDEDLTVEECGKLLGELKRGVSEIIFKVVPACQDVDESILDTFYESVADVDALVQYQDHRFGYTEDKACFAKIVHGWSGTVGPRDSRVTTSIGNPGLDNLFTGAHEMGHCLYSIGSSEEVIKAGIWGGMTCSAQESQSRFYENIICRSPEYWEYFYPFVQERFPKLRSVDKDTFLRAVLKVKPSFKRTTADELTYSIHPVIRFEIERDMFERKLDFKKLPEVWNDKYEESLGIRPTNDFEGCLQDVHWTEDFGKFQSYAMGNIFDGALLKRILVEIPDFYTQVSQGKFDDVHEWFGKHIHQYGFTYPTMQLMRRATGGEIESKYFLDYIRNKYFTLYNVKE